MSTAPLTADDIHAEVTLELARAQDLFPRWKHAYGGLEISRARRVLGQAHSDGRIKLSRVFIGTGARDDLRDTIRHEFAHLIAGLPARHGPRWKVVAAQLGATPRSSGARVCEELRQRMDDAPLTLMAIMASGEEVSIRPAFRRSRQYAEYHYGVGGRRYYYRGERVEYFRYRERR